MRFETRYTYDFVKRFLPPGCHRILEVGCGEGEVAACLIIRSLHHIHPLDESIRHAATGLVEGGLIIVDDFAYESTDEKTLRWFSSAIRLIEATGLLMVSDEFQHRVLSKTETLKAWRQSHEQQLHTAAEIDAHLKRVSRRVIRENAAYYFRYIASAITAVEKRDAILQAFAEQGKPLLLHPVLCELGKVDRRKKSRANREQLRCCNWIRLPNWANPRNFSGVKAGRR